MTSKYIVEGIPCLTLRYTLNITEKQDNIGSGPSIAISLSDKKEIKAKAESIIAAIDTELKMVQIIDDLWLDPFCIKMIRITEEIWLPQEQVSYWDFNRGYWFSKMSHSVNEDILDAEYTKWQLLSAENDSSDKKIGLMGTDQAAGTRFAGTLRV